MGNSLVFLLRSKLRFDGRRKPTIIIAPWEELALLSGTYNSVNLVRFQDGVLGDL